MPPPAPRGLESLSPARRRALRSLSATVLGAYGLRWGDRLQVGDGVLCNHRLIIKGPGRIELGDGANLFAFGYGRPTRLSARTPEARIVVGERARLNGAELHADTLIEVGPDCIIGFATILDTDMHALAPDRRTNPEGHVRTAPVVLEANVWVARGAAILPGVRVGRDSVVAFGSVVTEDVPPGVVVAGNPARVVRDLPPA
jgi:acetyltransferase-like isoleucine patch superfamily enzyme